MRKAFHKVIMFPCLICIFFYAGMQVVGETEASFSSQVASEPIELSAAIVFPGTIKQLEDRAQELASSMHLIYETIMATTPDVSLQVLYGRLAEIQNIEQKLNLQLAALNTIYDELSSYKNQTLDPAVPDLYTYDYVQEGFQAVQSILQEVKGTIDFKQLEIVRSSLKWQIKKLEEKEKSSEKNTQARGQEESESQDKAASYLDASTNSINHVEVKEDGEENMDHYK